MSKKLSAIELEKSYNPKDFEDRIYTLWEDNECFKPTEPENCKSRFTVVIPPPNVTGILHVGHALDNTLQDVIVRYHRMKGSQTLWVPGTDHAGIATQTVVEKQLKKEGKTKHDLGREAFLQYVWNVKENHHDIIVRQLKKMGVSADWSRERFTLDEGLSKAVREVFVTLYRQGLIYRGEYLVNWCPSCGTALADDEVEHEEKKGAMYHIYYMLDGEENAGRIEIATTRPETLLGDSALAVHPEDERYRDIIGKFALLPLTGRKIPIIADTYVDKEFGTGIVKITPAHDPNDWEVGKRHNLPIINILNTDGTLNEAVPEKYAGMTCAEAREAITADLEKEGLLKEVVKIKHAVGCCYRCKTVIEPYVSKQWFVKMKPLAEKAIKAWKEGGIKFYPQKWENTYAHWMNNIRDWCISRQLWWGHRIPVWYCKNCGGMTVSVTDACACSSCGGEKIEQDPDVLDTWFSSWLWPFSALGWPEKTKDFEQFYPTTALVTGHDIIFFWVARMIMAGLHFTEKVPFKDIYLHGLVRDKQGRKMSKSLGNGIDPLTVIDEYGADALKFSLAFLCAQGQDILLASDAFKLGSRFANKIWNASRYILGNLEGRTIEAVPYEKLNELDRWIYHALNEASGRTREALEAYRYNEASQIVYEFFWNNFCDWYVESTKLSFKNGDEKEKDRAASVLLNVLEESLRLLHPFLPFVTEEIYQKLPLNCAEGAAERSRILMTAAYPKFKEARISVQAANRFEALQEIVRNVRALRTECGIDPQLKLKAVLCIAENTPAQAACEKQEIIKMLAGLAEITFAASSAEKPAGSVGTAGTGFEAFLVTGGNVNKEQLKAKFQKDIEKDYLNAERLSSKLQNENFIKNVHPDLIAVEKEKLQALQLHIRKLNGYIEALK